MPRISTVVYSIKQGGKNLKRNQMFSLASIGTMTACLFLFGILTRGSATGVWNG